MSVAHGLDANVRPLRRLEYDKLVDDGCFEDEAVELLWGNLVRMNPRRSAHAAAVQYLTELFVLAVAPQKRATVRIQSPFAATDDSEPEPDVAIVPLGAYRDAHPTEAILIVEVAETSLKADRAKAAIYAAAGVPEYWIVNLTNDTVEVHRQPVIEEARYASVITHGSDAELPVAAVPDCTLRLLELFGTE